MIAALRPSACTSASFALLTLNADQNRLSDVEARQFVGFAFGAGQTEGVSRVCQMNRTFFFLMVSCWVNSFGQTNSPSVSAKLFSVSCPALRMTAVEKETPKRATADDQSDTPKSETRLSQTGMTFSIDSSGSEHAPSSEAMSVETRERAIMLRYHERLERGGYLTRPEPPSDNLLVRFADSTFRPEVFKIGKTSLSCSIVTAIKRKNPLCLLNPIVLNLSW